jgi:DNA polymerase III subunit alpha
MSDENKDLVHLHVHSEYSILDGCGKQDDFVDRAVELGSPAVCFTEHGSLRGIHKLHENATSAKIKPLYGIEFYAVKEHHERRGLSEEEAEKIRATSDSKLQQNRAIKEREQALGLRKRNHVTVIAKTNQGLKNLYWLSTKAWTDGFYARPRIDLDLLEEYGDGLIVLSGCLDGFANQALLAGDPVLAMVYIERMHARWGDDFYLEVMPNRLPQQIAVNRALARIHRATGIPLVATADVHYLLKSDWESHEVLLCVNTKRKMTDPTRWTFGCRDFWYSTRAEMAAQFSEFHPSLTIAEVSAAMDATVEIAGKCSAALDLNRFRALVPDPGVPKEHATEFQWLLALANEGWGKRDIAKRAAALAVKRGESEADVYNEYADRLRRELKQIKTQHVDRYFLVIRDLYDWARRQGIICGPGRGSAGGSLVAYLLGIIDVDPVEHGLIFERFLNPDRIDLPDIDCDFEDRRRFEIVNYLRERYGNERVAQISTVSRMTGKACLRDLARVLDVPPGEIDAVVTSIVTRSSGDERSSQTIEDAMNEFEVGRKFNTAYPDVLRFAKRMEGQSRGLGLHAAGVIVSSDVLTDWIPLETREHEGERITCTGVDMWGAEAQGLLKVDVLGLRTLSVLGDALAAIKERTGKTIDMNWIDLNDPAVLRNFTEGRFVGVFQFDTASAEKICEGVTFDRFDDIPAMVALDRPGTARSGLATEYLRRKADPSKRISIHPVIDKICADTLGIIVYQEHVIKIFTDVAGFAPGTADSLRKKIAKKWGDEALGKERENFINGAVSRGFTPELAAKLMDQITFFGSYGFNKSHATAYGLISYWEMWLKTYYPVEFMYGLLANEPDRTRVMKLVREARRLGVEVLPADVSESSTTFTIRGDAIRGGLVDLKGAGSAAVSSIVANQPYKSFSDFIERVDLRKCHKGVILALAKAGALGTLIPNAKWFVEHLEDMWKDRGKASWGAWLERVAESGSLPDYTEEQRTLISAEVNPLAFGRHPIEPHLAFLDGLDVEWPSMEGDGIWDRSWAWVRGVVVEQRYNQVGDFNSGTEPDDDAKRKMKWGARYANMNVEDQSGANKRVKLDVDVFDRYRHVVDRGVGISVVALCLLNKKWKSIKARALFDVNDLRNGPGPGGWPPLERSLMDPKGLFSGRKHDDITRILSGCARDSRKTGVGLVVAVNEKLDKNMRSMAFVDVYGRDGLVGMLCFSSQWPHAKDAISVGALVRLVVTVSKDSCFIESAKKL